MPSPGPSLMTGNIGTMEPGPSINFKSIRAKFQEDIQIKDRPVVPNKPKWVPLPSAHSVMSSTNAVVETRSTVLPHLILRKENGGMAGKGNRACTNLPNNINTKQSFKDRHLPLVLPVPAAHEPKHDRGALPNEAPAQLKCKKPVPLPLKSIKATKSAKYLIENGTEHPECCQTFKEMEGSTPRTSSPTSENGLNSGVEGSIPESLNASSEQSITPPPVESAEDSSSGGNTTLSLDQRVLGTLEKAKRKFSPKNLLVYTRPKSCHSSSGLVERSPPVDCEGLKPSVSPRSKSLPRVLPDCALPTPFRINSASPKAGIMFERNGAVRLDMTDWNGRQCPPVRRRPPLCLLGPLPPKPPRPPRVDLSPYRIKQEDQATAPEAPPCAPDFVPDIEILSVAPEDSPLLPAELDAPDFPEFEHSDLETTDIDVLDLAALGFEATEVVSAAPIELIPPLPEQSGQLNGLHPPAEHSSLGDDCQPEHAPAPTEDVAELEQEEGAQSASVPQTDIPQPVSSEAEMDSALEPCIDHHTSTDPPQELSSSQKESFYETCNNVYEDVQSVSKFHFAQSSRKRTKGGPKNPYADKRSANEEMRRNMWHITPRSASNGEHSVSNNSHGGRKDRCSPEHLEAKEQKKREKQRLEREKKEQKEKDKRENEMRKKFKVTGSEEPMYHARVTMASKVRKHDLQVKSGDSVGIIRTTNCPKGKWLARDANHQYGYISVMNVELNIKEMLELGKRASEAARRGHPEADTISIGSRSSNQNLMFTSSFTDGSEEWTFDDDNLSPLAESMSHNRAVSMPDVSCGHAGTHPSLSDGSMEDLTTQTKHEALQRLADFFQHKENLCPGDQDDPASSTSSKDDPSFLCSAEEPLSFPEQEDFNFAYVDPLPPPELYADAI